MKIIGIDEKKLKVDDSSLDENSRYKYVQQVTLIDDGVHLKKVWIATCEKNNKAFDCRPDELEFVCEKIFSKEPTEQDLICFMSENGLGMYDYCHVKEAYKLDCDFDD